MAEELRFIGIEKQGDRYKYGASTYTAQELMSTPGLARRAIFTFKVMVNNQLEVVGVEESNCPSEFIVKGDKFRLDSSGEFVQIYLNERKLGLVQEFELKLHATKPHTIRLVIINLDNRVHPVYEG